MSKVAVIAKLPVQPGKGEEFAQAFAQMFPVVEAEPGNIVYALHRDGSDENVFWVYELYADGDALAAHGSSDAFRTAMGAFAGMLGGAPEIMRLEPVQAKGLEF